MWEEVKTGKGGPAPRYDHSAAVYADQYLLIFGGSSHSTCFSDIYLLDLQTVSVIYSPCILPYRWICALSHIP
jgi:hypothetical protein